MLLCLIILWITVLCSVYKSMAFSKLRVAFNNVYRKILELPKWSSASEIYSMHNIENFEALLQKVIYGFIQWLEDSSNVIIRTLTKSWTICLVDWQSWLSKLYK